MKYTLGTTRSVASPTEAGVRAAAQVAARQAREFLDRADIRELLAQRRFSEVRDRATAELVGLALKGVERSLAASARAHFTAFRRTTPARPQPHLCLSSRAVNGPNTPAKASPAGFALTA